MFSHDDCNLYLHSQANILVNNDGRVYIAGLGAALDPADTIPAVDAYRSFPGVAPELVNPGRWGFHDAGPTVHSDVFAFAVLAWEVSIGQAPSANKLLSKMACVVRFSQDEPRSSTRVPWRGFTRC